MLGVPDAIAIAGKAPSAAASQFGKHSTYVHQRLLAGLKVIRGVTLLPPIVIARGCGGSETTREVPPSAGAEYTEMMRTALRGRGWQVDDTSLSYQALEGDTRRRLLFDYLRERTPNLVFELVNRPHDVERGRYSFGSDVGNLVASGQTDALVLVRGSVFPGWCSGDNGKMLYVDLFLLEPDTGEVLCFLTMEHVSVRKLTLARKSEVILEQLRRIP